MAASVRFELSDEFDATSRAVWDALVDWPGHGEWIPMTWIEVESGGPGAVGTRFTAFTGVWKLALPDRMEVARCEWDDGAGSGRCEVAKLGPVLIGRAEFTVAPRADGGATVTWLEDVSVRFAPTFASGIATTIGARFFRAGMRRLARRL